MWVHDLSAWIDVGALLGCGPHPCGCPTSCAWQAWKGHKAQCRATVAQAAQDRVEQKEENERIV